MKAAAGYKAQCDMSRDVFTLYSILTVLPPSVTGILQPAGPKGAQRFLESLWWAHWHPPRTGTAGAPGGCEEVAQAVEGEWGITGTWEIRVLESILQFREFEVKED